MSPMQSALLLVLRTLAILPFAHAVDLSASAVSRQQALEASWSEHLEGIESGANPVAHIVKLLEHMQADLKKEAEVDQQIYEKNRCYCDKNKKEREDSIEDCNAREPGLKATIESASALKAKLTEVKKQLKADIGKETGSLNDAVRQRDKEVKEFRKTEDELLDSINGCKAASQVLRFQAGTALLQVNTPIVSGLQTVLRDLALRNELLMANRQERMQSYPIPSKEAITSFLQLSSSNGVPDSVSSSLMNALDTSTKMDDSLDLASATKLVAKAVHTGLVEDRSSSSGAFLQANQQPLNPSSPVELKERSKNLDKIIATLETIQFNTNAELTDVKREEARKAEAFATMKKAKDEEIASLRTQLKDAEAQYLENEKVLAEAKQDLKELQSQRKEDQAFLKDLMEKCVPLDGQYQKRVQVRNEEVMALAEALKILTDQDNAGALYKATLVQVGSSPVASSDNINKNDEAAAETTAAADPQPVAGPSDAVGGDLQALDAELDSQDSSGSVPPVLLQLTSVSDGAHESAAAALVEAANTASGAHKIELTSLASQLRGNKGIFDKIYIALQKMIDEIKEEQINERKLKDYCFDQFSANKRDVRTKQNEIETLQDSLKRLKAIQERIKVELEAKDKAMQEVRDSIKQAGATREEENANFQTTVADQKAVDSVLQKAIVALESFYKKSSLLQTDGDEDGGDEDGGDEQQQQGQQLLQQQEDQQGPKPALPSSFGKQKAHDGGNAAIELIKSMANKAKAVQAEAMADEKEAQTAYVKFVKDGQDELKKMEQAVRKKRKQLNDKKTEENLANDDLSENNDALTSLAQFEADLHQQCDATTEGYEANTKARDRERQSLESARGTLKAAE
eukprot:TRINITY_DN1938_c0_g2_i1.p1 TRINITY_DN1938_c0_g2~~TRINITY_DN1938_c0_g2_i1.p1  ORF type:complete len:859 (+),score=247.88 TRINITY_DN1938_c0_g2_i1:173-2749(+)